RRTRRGRCASRPATARRAAGRRGRGGGEFRCRRSSGAHASRLVTSGSPRESARVTVGGTGNGAVTAVPRAVWIVFIGLMIGNALSSLDSTVVATALPTIVGDLHGIRDLS